MKRAYVLVAIIFAAGAAWSPVDAQSSDVPGSLSVGGISRTYVAHVPATLGASVPLVLSFHGHGSDGMQQARLTDFDALSDRDGFIVVYPDGIHRGWNDGRPQSAGADDIAFVRALIADFSRRYPIDRTRIYATGFSNGGTFTEYLGCVMTSTFAGLAPVSGSMPAADVGSCHPARPIPVLTIAGTGDPIMPYTGGEIRLLGVDRGTVISAAATAAFWASNDRCARTPRRTVLPPIAATDGTRVTQTSYSGCAPGTSVELDTIEGGGHAWPGGPQYAPKMFIGPASKQLDATKAIADFFKLQ
jgi:polyhydroxybutyrate depolymerase